MRENRPYGSEGGVGESRSLPLSADRPAGNTLRQQDQASFRPSTAQEPPTQNVEEAKNGPGEGPSVRGGNR